MRGRVNQVETDGDRYGFTKPADSLFSKKRLDLNDLRKRAEEKRKYDKRINLLIFSGAASVIVVFFIIFSL